MKITLMALAITLAAAASQMQKPFTQTEVAANQCTSGSNGGGAE